MDDAEIVRDVLAWLSEKGSQTVRDGLLGFSIPSDRAFGVSVGDLRKYAKQLGIDHVLAQALWRSAKYEARLLATFVADPELVTPKLMEHWCRDFDSWALCDTACFGLFDRTEHAFAKVKEWSTREGEFQRRAAFALLAGLAQHDEDTPDEAFLQCLPLIEAAASDGRNFVKKGVNWALRGIGERSRVLHKEALAVARRLARSEQAAASWVGRDAEQKLRRPTVRAKLKRRAKK